MTSKTASVVPRGWAITATLAKDEVLQRLRVAEGGGEANSRLSLETNRCRLPRPNSSA
jgi:hypothetical protein